MGAETHTGAMKSIYLEYIKEMREYGVERGERIQREWEKRPPELRGPEPGNMGGAQAVIDALLYHATGEEHYAESAAGLLADNDLSMYPCIQACEELAGSPAMTPEVRARIDERIARQASMFLEHHVEWGAMNHATNYIVDGMMAAAKAFPNHPRCRDWTQFAEKMLATSWGKWGIEDSQNYSPYGFCLLCTMRI